MERGHSCLQRQSNADTLVRNERDGAKAKLTRKLLKLNAAAPQGSLADKSVRVPVIFQTIII